MEKTALERDLETELANIEINGGKRVYEDEIISAATLDDLFRKYTVEEARELMKDPRRSTQLIVEADISRYQWMVAGDMVPSVLRKWNYYGLNVEYQAFFDDRILSEGMSLHQPGRILFSLNVDYLSCEDICAELDLDFRAIEERYKKEAEVRYKMCRKVSVGRRKPDYHRFHGGEIEVWSLNKRRFDPERIVQGLIELIKPKK